MKKHVRVALASVMAFTLAGACMLAGCSGGAGEKEQEPAAQEQQQSEEPHEAVELQVFAANSLQKAMPEVMAAYQEEHDWVTFADAQYLSSGDLVTQLKGGAYSDILITASKSTMDQAEEGALVDAATRFDMFANDLVVVAKEGSDIKIDSLEDVVNYSLCIGDESVPAGNYARQALSTVGAYEGGEAGRGGEYVGIEPLLDTSVGNVCKHAASGEVDLAIVYSSDVYRFDGVEVVYEIPADTHKAIVYPAAICSVAEDAQATAAQDFIDWAISDPAAIAIWQEWGFALA